MHYIVWITVGGFYTQRYEEPVVIHHQNHVIEASNELQLRGIGAGLPLKQARALVGSARFVEYEPADYVNESKTWMNCLLSYTDHLQTDGQAAAWIDISPHPDPDFILRQLLADLSTKFTYRLNFGVGRSRWIAKLAHQYPFNLDSIKKPAEYLAHHPIHEISFLTPEISEKLQFLGYHTCGDLQKIPRHILLKQFGHEAEIIHQAAFGGHQETVQRNFPDRSASASLSFEAPIQDTAQLESALKTLSAELAKKLSIDSTFTHKLMLILETENGIFESLERTFHQPLYSMLGILNALNLMFLNHTFKEFHSIRVILIDLKNKTEIQQSFNASNRMEVVSALDTIHIAYGKNSVRLASELKPSWKQTFLKQWMASLGNA